jgi:hypothetical protein
MRDAVEAVARGVDAGLIETARRLCMLAAVAAADSMSDDTTPTEDRVPGKAAELSCEGARLLARLAPS